MNLDLAQIVQRVRRLDPIREAEPSAAVAVILREGPQILLIRRAEHPNDPWSGHMAFPGGRRDTADTSLQHTATRETLEEIGLDLSAHGKLVGALHDVPTHMTGLVVRPFVWRIDDAPAFALNHEVAAVGWVDLASLLSGARSASHSLEWKGQTYTLPAYEVDDGIVWGLTYRMLQILFEVLRSR